MDLDKPLDDMITSNKRSNSNSNARPRQSRERRDVPYARPAPRSTEDKWVHDAYQGGGRGGGRGAFNGGGGRQATDVAGTGVGFTGVSPRIEVVGLHYEVTPQDLKTIFAQAGTLVQGPTIRYDFSGRSKGEATMEFASYQQAKVAINKFDGAMTKGQTISIRLLPPAVQRGPAGAGKPQGAPGGNLLSRISGGTPPVSAQRSSAPRGVPRGGVRGGRGAPRGRGAPGAGRGGRRAPATSGDLDGELDSFMKNDTKTGGDVEMS